MYRRSSFEIYLDILTEIESGKVLLTHIMYGVNMSWGPLKKTIEKFIDQGLVLEQSMEVNNRLRKVYTLTEKGDKFLNCLKRGKEILDSDKEVDINI